MIKIMKSGNIFRATTNHGTPEAIVIPINCVGVMGKGIALQSKKVFPTNFIEYKSACLCNRVQPGQILTSFDLNLKMDILQWVFNFPTKRHWRNKSLICDIESGLKALIKKIERLSIKSVAIPPLGCGLGGLDWDVVRPLIEKAFKPYPKVEVLLYAPRSRTIKEK